MRTRDTDLIVTMVDFERPGVGTHQYMTQESFENNVINNEYFQKALEAGLIKCLLTHQGRDYADNDKSGTPYDDLLATHPDLCGVVRDVWLDGSKAMASIDLFDGQAFPAAAKLKDLIKKGTFVGVSMATECEINGNGNYDITALLGCDFTLDNFFMGSGIVTIKKNFSRQQTAMRINFSNKDFNDMYFSESFEYELEDSYNFANYEEDKMLAKNFAAEVSDEEYNDLVEEHGEEYLQEKDPDSAVFNMDDLNDVLSDREPHDILLMGFNGYRYNPYDNKEDFNPNDEYFAISGYGNLVSILETDLTDYVKSNISSKEDFVDWCIEQGHIEEEEEEE